MPNFGRKFEQAIFILFLIVKLLHSTSSSHLKKQRIEKWKQKVFTFGLKMT